MNMGIHLEHSDNKIIIACDGDQAGRQLHDVRTSLIKALINADEVAVDLQNITNADLAFLQLLCSAHRSAGRLNKHFIFIGPRPDVLDAVAASAGYLRQVGCSLDTSKTCLWTAQYDRRAS